MTGEEPVQEDERSEPIVIREARCALGPTNAEIGSIEIASGRIKRILQGAQAARTAQANCADIDLSGYLVMPGLINAHDHLEFSLHPRMADPPYCNYIEWGEDIHRKYPDVFAKRHVVPRDVRLWWGGIRNLFCGVTTVGHHNPLWPELQRSDFPIRVVGKFGWAHSAALGGDLQAARAATPQDRPFIVHACEGVDDVAREELWELDRQGILDANAVLVHGLAIDDEGVTLLMERGTALIVCPSSNFFLYGSLPNMATLGRLGRVALGSDSPLTAAGDLLDEVQFVVDARRVSPAEAYRMVTTIAAQVLQLKNCEGTLRESGVADLIAVRDTDANCAERFASLSNCDVELVMIGGRVQLVSLSMLERLPPSLLDGLEPLSLGQMTRWVRAPIGELLRRTEEIFGKDGVSLGGRTVRMPAFAEAEHVC